MPTEQLISLLSAFIAILSAIYAMRSTAIAKRALAIAEEDHQSKKESLKLYLIEGVNYITKEDSYIFAFNVSVTNGASISNSLQRIELIITYIRSDDTYGNIILQHDETLNQSITGHNVTPFSQSFEISEKSASTSWCLFSHSDKAKKFGRIDKYTLRITDIAGEITEVDSYLIKEYRIV